MNYKTDHSKQKKWTKKTAKTAKTKRQDSQGGNDKDPYKAKWVAQDNWQDMYM